ncbi:alpha/beta hydrolase [Pseudanabaena sp. FACHB-1998]|uniref:alpha/beta hydrolase n=1 Tax=Pseudanabaena sp. FACHB-1998 TaxID=2692858 RepID=UPI001680984B|nr:alpha/beta hydrolase [Pseudanabaena sp. FACHB-1998]MBD2176581.1 alpha/beta hydrolase [Pseudanabaena sp. FACHB-1998]
MLKPIRFFATNRDLDNLGRDVNRDQRIKLQKGGYHWIDMKKYMAHYLSTTDSEVMPSEAIVQNSQETVFDQFLANPSRSVKRIIIGIHGFNVPLHGALTSFSLLADTLSLALAKHGKKLITEPILNEEYQPDENGEPKIHSNYDPILDDPNQDLTAFVGFSWPSNGSILDYASDRAETLQTAPILGNLISYIRTQNPQAKIHIIGHSMGNYLVCNMLRGLINETYKPVFAINNEEIDKQLKRTDKGGANAYFVDRYLMLAPDVERREVTQCDVDGIPNGKSDYIGPFHAGLKHLIEETHLFYSRYDKALQASKVEKQIFHEAIQKGKELFTGKDLQKRWEDSLGLNPLPALAPSNMYSHNATVLTNREIDHGDYFDAFAIAEEMAKIIIEAD